MNVTKEIPKEMTIEDPSGRVFSQKVLYDWLLVYCNKCQIIGHNCAYSLPKKPVKQVQKWVPKNTVPSHSVEVPVNIGVPPLVVDPSLAGEPAKEVELSITETTPVNTPEPIQGEEEEEPWKVVTRKSKGKQVSFQSTRVVSFSQEPGRPGVKIKETRVFLQHHGVDFCALFETRVRDHKASNVQKKIGNIWSWEDNYGFSPRVYGLHTIADRRQLWVDLREMVDNADFPYLIIGDFNAVSQASDRINGTLVSEAETVDFSDFLMEVEYLAEGISDHTPLLVSFYAMQEGGGRPFRFNNVLVEDINFINTVKEAWESTGNTCKLKECLKEVKGSKRGLEKASQHSLLTGSP
ncbi:uncharacterized protein LOC104884259 [Beta vulgaris subsp. vulgaris]|uniref:uncharacterized protein LOC104884259 n=1 Tax=Beta vulgaris subsp. vulgaris TaxID=3555 RepID=UPI000540236E|nr:uncharacterized protein LOC104884259 [Beta vulgaris subsp. vulgaris]